MRKSQLISLSMASTSLKVKHDITAQDLLKALSIILCALLFLSCKSDPVTDQLEKAEIVIDNNPEEALNIIEGIDSKIEMHKSTKAKYNMLLTQALVKGKRELPPDSLISFSADYFTETGDKLRAIKSLYYLGVLTFRSGNYPKSTDVSLKGLNLAKECEDPFWIALLSRNLADIFSVTYGGAEQIKYAFESLNGFKEANKQVFVNYAILDYARALINNGRYSEALPLLTEAIDSADVYNDGGLKTSAFRSMGTAYLGLNEFDKASECFKIVCESGIAGKLDSCYLGQAYAELGNTKES